jgi:hypothetical protein
MDPDHPRWHVNGKAIAEFFGSNIFGTPRDLTGSGGKSRETCAILPLNVV